MSVSATAMVPTKSASRYLQQLCKHWAHNMPVEFSAAQGTVTFPRTARGGEWPDDGLFTMIAHSQALECRIDASGPEHLAGLKGAVERHLDRFAFREAPLNYVWTAV